MPHDARSNRNPLPTLIVGTMKDTYNTEILLDREFMRRMIRAYEQDLLQLVDEDNPHPNHAQIVDHLNILELLREFTFSPFQRSITF